MPQPSRDGHARRGRVVVVDVWAHNPEEELAHICDPELAHRYPIAAVAAACYEGKATLPRTRRRRRSA